nr:helix-turn-helix transcriptional regulator [uncultured Cohaesibacter sp.]
MRTGEIVLTSRRITVNYGIINTNNRNLRYKMINQSGARLKLLRLNLNLTQSGLAEAVGYSQGYVSDIESDRSKPSSKFVKTLITLFPNVNGDWLLTGEGEMLKAPLQQTGSDVPYRPRSRPELPTREMMLQDFVSSPRSIDPALFETIAKQVSKEHEKHGLKLAPIVLTVETAKIYNNIASRVVDMNDKAAVEAMIPVAIRELGERLKEAEAEPGTGKRLA